MDENAFTNTHSLNVVHVVARYDLGFGKAKQSKEDMFHQRALANFSKLKYSQCQDLAASFEIDTSVRR